MLFLLTYLTSWANLTRRYPPGCNALSLFRAHRSSLQCTTLLFSALFSALLFSVQLFSSQLFVLLFSMHCSSLLCTALCFALLLLCSNPIFLLTYPNLFYLYTILSSYHQSEILTMWLNDFIVHMRKFVIALSWPLPLFLLFILLTTVMNEVGFHQCLPFIYGYKKQ